MHSLFLASHEFKNSFARNRAPLLSQTFTNSNFHFLIIALTATFQALLQQPQKRFYCLEIASQTTSATFISNSSLCALALSGWGSPLATNHVFRSLEQHFKCHPFFSMRKTKWLFMKGYEFKCQIPTTTEFLKSCQVETYAHYSQRLLWELVIS